MLTILGSEYNGTSDALEIYVSGCKRDCLGCHNPEGHAFGKGKSWRLWLKENTWKLKTGPFGRVWMLGGDLVGQPAPEAVEFLTDLRRAMPDTSGSAGRAVARDSEGGAFAELACANRRRTPGAGKELWLWTGAETLKAVPVAYLPFFDVVKTGSYKRHLPPVDADVYGDGTEIITLASNNQRFHNLEAARV